MHHAPSVSYPVARSRFFGALLVSLWLCGGGWVVTWCFQAGSMGWRQWVACVAVVIAGVGAARSWFSMPSGTLRWDGQHWLWLRPDGTGPVALTVHLDFQSKLLLCLRPAMGRRLWCWVERDRMPERWIDLRRAVYSPARSLAVSDGATAPLEP